MHRAAQLELPRTEPHSQAAAPQSLLPHLDSTPSPSLTVAGLFAGIGGIELGLELAGHQSVLLCEIDAGARAVLEERFPGIALHGDVRSLTNLGQVDLLAAGFPCQDLSQAGETKGITGSQSGLVNEVFRLVELDQNLKWLLLENVPFMLHLQRGAAMESLVSWLERHHFRWAYRVVDARAFGLPQRRQRVVLLASRTEDPRAVLFADEAGEPPLSSQATSFGFYWTEGIRGLGWAEDAIPTLKGGSTIGIPSPPAIWFRDYGTFGLPDIRDAERLQGFPEDWTAPAMRLGPRLGARWKLVGNAVSVPLSNWLGRRFRHPGCGEFGGSSRLASGSPWPSAAWGEGGARYRAAISRWPLREPMTPLSRFLKFPTKPLSAKASHGFLGRTRRSSLRFPEGFLAALEAYTARLDGDGA
jgi:DNA (cytosine-5)-methyltransferase 1